MMTTWHPTAPAAFDAAVVPLAGTRAEVMRTLGLHASTYYSALAGDRDGTRAAVSWCQRWAEARPGERIRLEFDTEMGWRAEAKTTKTAPPRRTGEGQREER